MYRPVVATRESEAERGVDVLRVMRENLDRRFRKAYGVFAAGFAVLLVLVVYLLLSNAGVSSGLGSDGDSISSLNARVNELTKRIDTLDEASSITTPIAGSVDSRLSDLEESLDELSKTVDGLSSGDAKVFEDVKTGVADSKDKLAALTQDVSKLTEGVSDLESRVGELETKLNTLASASVRPSNPRVDRGAVMRDVAVIGDSIVMEAGDDISAAVPGATIDAAYSRSFDTGGVGEDSSYGMVDAVRKHAASGVSLVVCMGNNDWQGVSATDGVALAKAAGESELYLVTMMSRDNLQATDTTNATIRFLADTYSNVHVIDWYAVASSHPEYLRDTCHMTDAGRQAYVGLIASAFSVMV